MKKVISLLLAMMLLMLLVPAALSESQGTDMYVCTGNGKPLKVRSSMSTEDDSNVLGTLKYGTKVITYGHQNGWAIINQALEMRDNLTVIILCHSETISDENGIIRTRIKTNGRKLEKLVLESKMTTVIWSVRQDGKYKFILSADGSTCKVPMGSFDTDECDNDIMIVIKALEDF